MKLLAPLLTIAATGVQADPLWKRFLQFKKQFLIEFESLEEETHRFSIFRENMKKADHLTEKSKGQAQFGATKFSHLTPEEFKKTYLGAVPPKDLEEKKKERKAKGLVGVRKNFPEILKSKSGESIDWRKKGCVTAVKDQGQCGSCWAFSATEAIETGYCKHTGNLKVLAPQQITSCDAGDYGCGGGWTDHAYQYAESAGGIELEADYPYTSGSTEQNGVCEADESKYTVKVGDYKYISQDAEGESDMMTQIQDSPMSICVDAETWQFYFGGVVDSSTCGSSVDHCVHLVGYKGGDDNYWIVKNSWNTNWGNNGYIYVRQGENACAIASTATIVDAYDEPFKAKDVFV